MQKLNNYAVFQEPRSRIGRQPSTQRCRLAWAGEDTLLVAWGVLVRVAVMKIGPDGTYQVGFKLPGDFWGSESAAADLYVLRVSSWEPVVTEAKTLEKESKAIKTY